MRKLNKKGFTLVELLAVIVVLAIIMVLVVPTVLDSVDDARYRSFIVEGEKLLNSAQTQYQADVLNGLQATKDVCYPIKTLDETASATYDGYVLVNKTDSSKDMYTIWFSDNNYVTGKTTESAGKLTLTAGAVSSGSLSKSSSEEADTVKSAVLKLSGTTVVKASADCPSGYSAPASGSKYKAYSK